MFQTIDEGFRRPEDVWEWIIENRRGLKKLCGLVAVKYNQKNMEDEIFSDVVLVRVPRLWESFDSEKGVPFSKYVKLSLNWWIGKYLVKRRDTVCFTDIIDDEENGTTFEPCTEPPQVTYDVQKVLQQLTGEERRLILLRDGMDLSFWEVGEAFCISKDTAAKLYDEAIRKARRIARKQTED